MSQERPPSQDQHLRINADDFGLDAKTDAGIALAARTGWIHSLSFFSGLNTASRDALRGLLQERPSLRMGVHLSLVEMPPFHPQTPRYSESQAAPPDFKAFLSWYAQGGIKVDAIYREWKLQIEKARELAPIHHLDSHQHLHVLPGIWEVICKLRQEFGISRLRVPYESLRESVFHRFPLGFAFQALAYKRWRQASSLNPMPEHFLGYFTSTRFRFEAYRQKIKRVLALGQPCELMVHPVLGNAEMTELESLSAWLAKGMP